MRYISRRSFLPFVIYRILLGVAADGLLATGPRGLTRSGYALRRGTSSDRSQTAEYERDPPRVGGSDRAGRQGSSPASRVVGLVAALAQVLLELLGDRLAARLGGVDGVARLLELLDVRGHVVVVAGERVDAALPGRGLLDEVAAGDRRRR